MAHPGSFGAFLSFGILIILVIFVSGSDAGGRDQLHEAPVKDPLGRPRTVNAAAENHRFCEYSRYMKHPRYSGYVDINRKQGSSMYYAYYEAQHMGDKRRTPILLWLQGGPGCASTFGAFYEVGPDIFDDTGRHKWKPRLVRNPGSWNKIFGLLIIDQPIGTGYSLVGKDKIPSDELGVASHLYIALRSFFARHHHLQHRPFFITGESYGGKYVPSIAHYILEAEQVHAQSKPGRKPLRVTRSLGRSVPPPNFNFTGIAIGNAWVDPAIQTIQIADVVHRLGLVAGSGKELVQNITMEVLGLVDAGEWERAHRRRSHMISVIERLSGVGTLLDVRRYEPYDSSLAVDRLLNCRDVKRRLRADRHVRYESCSAKVDDALSADVMKSVANLIPDILDAVPVLLYQGQFDAQDGPSSNEAWVGNLKWSGRDRFLALNASLWKSPYGEVQGWYKLQYPLSQVVIRNAGHLVPHDQPIPALEMIAGWVYLALTNKTVQLGPIPSGLLENGWDEETLESVKFEANANTDDVGMTHHEDMYPHDDKDESDDDLEHEDHDDSYRQSRHEHEDDEDDKNDDDDDDDDDDDNDDDDEHHEAHHDGHHEGHHEDDDDDDVNDKAGQHDMDERSKQDGHGKEEDNDAAEKEGLDDGQKEDVTGAMVAEEDSDDAVEKLQVTRY